MIYNDYMSRLEFMLSTAKIKFGSANEAYEKICRESEGHNDLVSRTARKSAFRKRMSLKRKSATSKRPSGFSPNSKG